MAVFLANDPAIRIGMIVLATDALPPHLLAVLHAVLHVADAQVVSSRERVMAVGARQMDGGCTGSADNLRSIEVEFGHRDRGGARDAGSFIDF